MLLRYLLGNLLLEHTFQVCFNSALTMYRHWCSILVTVIQVRRGVDRADIYSIALSPNVQWLAVSSDKGTVHIFSLRVRIVGEDASNQNVVGQGPGLAHKNSSSALDALVSPNTGANTSSSLSFMKGKHHYSLWHVFFQD